MKMCIRDRIQEGLKNIAAGANAIILRKGMQKATDAAVAEIKKMSQAVTTKKHIANVAAISAGDEEVGNMIADAMEKVTNDGVITVEESKTMKTELDLVEGMQFDKGYLSAYMCTDMDLSLIHIYCSQPCYGQRDHYSDTDQCDPHNLQHWYNSDGNSLV